MPIAIGNENALSCDSSTTFISSHLVSFCFIPRSVCRADFLSPSYTRVWDSYEKGKKLGSGAFGTVVIGVSRDTSRQEHAIKIIPKSKVRNIKALEREIAIMKRLDHESIIKLHSAFEDEKNVFLAMDLCKGGELYDRICKMEYLSEKEASFYVKQILEALEYCHGEGIVVSFGQSETLIARGMKLTRLCSHAPVAALLPARVGQHRDLKPENFILKSKVSWSGRLKGMLGVVTSLSFQRSRTSLCHLLSCVLASCPPV